LSLHAATEPQHLKIEESQFMTMNSPASHASASTPNASALASAATSLREFLAFKLGAEEYGIDILRVQEIRSYEEPTRIANAPSFIKGVVNLRGVIVPIVDMRLKFNLAQVNYDSFTVVIVLNIGARVVGMVVDAVSDVITLTPEQLRPVPAFNSGIDSDHLLAIGAIEQRMLILVDIEKLMTSPEMGLVEQALQ
jgi:purine-binding chemotaxis protein CheW